MMATIQLYSECSYATTNIPNCFIDKFMPEANGEFVKVYLYLLRSLESNATGCAVSAIADCFNHTEKDVIRALKYWERMHLLHLEYDADKNIRGIHFLRPEDASTDYGSNGQPASALRRRLADSPAPVLQTATPAEAAAPRVDNITPMPAKASRRNYTLDEIKEFRKNSEISELFFIIETYLKRPLTSNDINTILFWYDNLHFSNDLIDYLVEYCISKGHSSIRYMDKVALGWFEAGISTVEQAKENAAIHSQAYYGVMKAMGITGRNLVDAEQAFIIRWTREYGFELPLIQEACGRTIAATHQPSFEYADSILKNWKKNQVHTLKDVQKLDEAFNSSKKNISGSTVPTGTKHNKFNNFNQRDYDYDQLEKMLLTTSVQ